MVSRLYKRQLIETKPPSVTGWYHTCGGQLYWFSNFKIWSRSSLPYPVERINKAYPHYWYEEVEERKPATKGLELIQQEREEQLFKHGKSIAQDVVSNYIEQLSFAAAILSCPRPIAYGSPKNNYACPIGWNTEMWLKMIRKPYKERLVIAGALLAAEIDRLQATQ